MIEFASSAIETAMAIAAPMAATWNTKKGFNAILQAGEGSLNEFQRLDG